MEYSSGTVRVIYGRGVARLQPLLAKALALVAVGAALLMGYLVLAGAALAVMITALAGGLDPVHQISRQFWQDVEWWLVVQVISMGIAILLAAAAAGIGRSLAFGIAAALSFYPADNFLNLLEYLLLKLLEPDHRAPHGVCGDSGRRLLPSTRSP